MVCHRVNPEDEGDMSATYTRVRALCGAECLIGPDGSPIPDDFDYVLSPDPLQLTDCGPCLDKLTRWSVGRESVGARAVEVA